MFKKIKEKMSKAVTKLNYMMVKFGGAIEFGFMVAELVCGVVVDAIVTYHATKAVLGVRA